MELIKLWSILEKTDVKSYGSNFSSESKYPLDVGHQLILLFNVK